MKSFDFSCECCPWCEMLWNTNSEKWGPKCEKSDAKYPTIHCLCFAFPDIVWVFCDTCIASLKLDPHSAWFIFLMRHASWFAHRVYEKMCLIWTDVSFVHSSHLVCQLDGKLTHQSKLYVSDSTNLFDTFTQDAPRIRTTHRVDPA